MRFALPLLGATMLAAAATMPAFTGAALAQTKVPPSAETPNLPGKPATAVEADADDPAVWIHPTAREKSLVAAAVKDGGIRVYDLSARLVQTVLPARTDKGDGRINNVDVAYGLKFPGGRTADVVVATDRGLDVIRVFRIDGDAGKPLVEITAKPSRRAFPERPRDDGTGAIANPLDDQNTAYGLALWKRPNGEVLAVATQRGEPRLGLFRLEPKANGTVDVAYVRDFRFPVRFRGQDLRQENDDNPDKDWSPQFEGLVVDQRTGILYAGEEDVGLWRIDLGEECNRRHRCGSSGAAGPAAAGVPLKPFYTTRGAPGSPFRERSSHIARDVEGLTIYYGKADTGYLLASSQGQAHGDERAPEPPYDDTFAVFRLDGAATPRFLGSFRVGRSKDGAIDAVQESDGAEVISTELPGFPGGLFITQDGYDGDDFSGDVDSTNFKFVDWRAVADAFDPPLAITPGAYDPRRP
jgi:3-phytase